MSEEIQPAMELLSFAEDQTPSQESWVEDITLLEDGSHAINIIKDGVTQARNISVARSLDKLEIEYTDGDWMVTQVVRPNGLIYTTKVYTGSELGIPRTEVSRGRWRYYK
tara:strand:+ start:171 stop:500 length:330 start_codon:yes stop_codon:yes gene_type:complete